MKDASFGEIARRNLEEIVQRGKTRAGEVVARIRDEIPSDSIVAASALRFEANVDGGLDVAIGDQVYAVHNNALGQLAERVAVPTKYLRDLLVPDVLETRADGSVQVVRSLDWRRQLAEQILGAHSRNSRSRYLVRAVGPQVRAVLSDRFRRLDARPLFDAFAGACQSIGAIAVDGTSSDVRVSVQAILPQIHEPIANDPVVLGLEWSNSDFGKAPYSIRLVVIRLVCKNGMIGNREISQRHLGGRLDSNIEWSSRTLDSDTETMRLATEDVVRGALGPARVSAYLEEVQSAARETTSFAAAVRHVAKDLTKAEREAAAGVFESPDVVNLPAGKTLWRASNAISWLANGDDVGAERRLELQELAGKILPVRAAA
jgi:hypothetical protein